MGSKQKQTEGSSKTAATGREFASLIRTTSEVKRVYESLMSSRGITLQQYNVLRIIRGAGGSLETMEIGERLMERTPGITRLIDRLEKKGLIRRVRSVGDRRQISCELTPLGAAVLKGLDDEADALDRSVIDSLSKKERKILVELLDRIRASLETA